jgi:hypothetical protein
VSSPSIEAWRASSRIESALSGSVAEVPTASFRLSAGLKVLF